MTVKQKQALLLYLGYYVGNIDGSWGQLSKTATRSFKRDYGLADNSEFDAATEKKILSVVATGEKPKPTTTASDDWKNIRYFQKSEFKCQCGGRYCNGYPVEIDMTMVGYADEIRHRLGKPLRVNSGLRDPRHNAAVGGVSNSQHVYGTAVDLGCPSGTTPAKMAAIAEEVMGGTGGIGIYNWGIHIDSRKTKSRWNG
jgi:uncharacterized protein YcbK (DUF882 family)